MSFEVAAALGLSYEQEVAPCERAAAQDRLATMERKRVDLAARLRAVDWKAREAREERICANVMAGFYRAASRDGCRHAGRAADLAEAASRVCRQRLVLLARQRDDAKRQLAAARPGLDTARKEACALEGEARRREAVNAWVDDRCQRFLSRRREKARGL